MRKIKGALIVVCVLLAISALHTVSAQDSIPLQVDLAAFKFKAGKATRVAKIETYVPSQSNQLAIVELTGTSPCDCMMAASNLAFNVIGFSADDIYQFGSVGVKFGDEWIIPPDSSQRVFRVALRKVSKGERVTISVAFDIPPDFNRFIVQVPSDAGDVDLTTK